MYYIYLIFNSNIYFCVLFFVAGMYFGAFVRSVPKEEKQELEAGETMCGEMTYYQRAYICALLPRTPGSLRGG